MGDSEVGRVCLPFSPLRFTDAPVPAPKLSPFLNQHEEDVLGGAKAGGWIREANGRRGCPRHYCETQPKNHRARRNVARQVHFPMIRRA